jgi:adenosylcobinamide amidohydrolase
LQRLRCPAEDRKVLAQPKTAQRTAKSAAPWQWSIERRSLIIRLPEINQVLSWAPFNGGPRRAIAIVNHQIEPGDRAACERPRPYLEALMRKLGLVPRAAVAMMTGVPIRKASYAAARRADLIVGAWCTAGCSNALRVGDPATFGTVRPGTINIALVVNQPLTQSAMAEALAMATEARVAAMHEARIASVLSQRPATGTGTDCIVVASPTRGPAHAYCGKHTVLGELIGKAAMRSCERALRRFDNWARKTS